MERHRQLADLDAGLRALRAKRGAAAPSPAKRSPAATFVGLVVIGVIVWAVFFRGSGSTSDVSPDGAARQWTLAVTGNAKYTSSTVVGGDIDVTLIVANTGAAANPATKIQIVGIDDYADIASCEPACGVSNAFGRSATVAAVDPGRSTAITVHMIAKAVGAPHWSVCVYDDAEATNEIYCGSATTTIR